MNVLTIFDQRITAIFAKGAPGKRLPFSFKRLAKRAVREMEDETFVIDGVDTAPALYTVLISTADDALMRPMYVQITDEISQLIEAQAKKRGYTFVGRPLVRFMVDPALRAGRFAVFAENIDPRTLARLRDEENAYLGITPPHEIYPNQGFAPAPVPVHEDEPAPVSQEVAFSDPLSVSVEYDSGASLGAQPFEEGLPLNVDSVGQNDVSSSEVGFESDPLEVDSFSSAPEDRGTSRSIEGEKTAQVSSFSAAPGPMEKPVRMEPACTLVDLGSGRVYHVTNARVTIGRERVGGGVVLTDPNASRRHAELVFDGSAWLVHDLNSTNGTLVNDVDVAEALLHDGDVLTIGLTNLEFREG